MTTNDLARCGVSVGCSALTQDIDPNLAQRLTCFFRVLDGRTSNCFSEVYITFYSLGLISYLSQDMRPCLF